MNQSLANKYRSKTFDDLIGQDHISTILKHQALGHVRQANYLFFGPRGTGKTSSARLFAKAINCLNIEKTGGNPCNECENCLAINSGSTLDIMELDAASHTGIDNIREEIIDKIVYRPTQLKKRVTIIDEVHMLSKGAFNALLKTMEEPTEWMVFILATTEFQKIPETIVSRCQLFNFKKIPTDLIVDRLHYISEKEQIDFNEGGLQMIADLSDGCMRDAVKYLDQISVMGNVDDQSVAQFLGVVSEARLKNFIDLYKDYHTHHDTARFEKLIHCISEFDQQGIDLTNLPKQLVAYANHHFEEDMQLYSQLSVLAGELISQARWFPHPLLLYKTLLYKENSHQGKEDTDSSSTTSSKHKDTLSSSQSLSSGKKEQPSSSSSHKSSSHQTSASSKQPKESLPSQEQTKENTIVGSHDFDHIWKQVLNLLSQSFQNLLYGQSELIRLETGSATIIITNPIAKMTFKQKKNHDNLVEILSKIAQKNIENLEFNFMSKEEYFDYQLTRSA